MYSLLNAHKDRLDVEVHDLLEGALRVLVKRGSPSCAGICEQDVDMICVLANLCDQSFRLALFRKVRWDGNRFALDSG